MNIYVTYQTYFGEGAFQINFFGLISQQLTFTSLIKLILAKEHSKAILSDLSIKSEHIRHLSDKFWRRRLPNKFFQDLSLKN